MAGPEGDVGELGGGIVGVDVDVEGLLDAEVHLAEDGPVGGPARGDVCDEEDRVLDRRDEEPGVVRAHRHARGVEHAPRAQRRGRQLHRVGVVAGEHAGGGVERQRLHHALRARHEDPVRRGVGDALVERLRIAEVDLAQRRLLRRDLGGIDAADDVVAVAEIHGEDEPGAGHGHHVGGHRLLIGEDEVGAGRAEPPPVGHHPHRGVVGIDAGELDRVAGGRRGRALARHRRGVGAVPGPAAVGVGDLGPGVEVLAGVGRGRLGAAAQRAVVRARGVDRGEGGGIGAGAAAAAGRGARGVLSRPAASSRERQGDEEREDREGAAHQAARLPRGARSRERSQEAAGVGFDSMTSRRVLRAVTASRARASARSLRGTPECPGT